MVRKIHTRVKRHLDIPTHKCGSRFIKSKYVHVNRPRTFKTEAAAQKYAAEHKVKEFTLKKVKLGKRFQIVEQKK